MLGRAASLAVAVLLLHPSCAGGGKEGKTPSGARASCAEDADCTVVDSVNCCAPCLEAPRAIPTLAFERQANRCDAVECEPASDRIECPKVEPKAVFVAKCKDGTCAAVRR